MGLIDINEVIQVDKDHIWYNNRQYISLRRLSEMIFELHHGKPDYSGCEDCIQSHKGGDHG